MSEIVRFPDKPAAANDDAQTRRDHIQTARLFAEAGLMSPVEYERKRKEIAARIGVRVSFVDKTVAMIREGLDRFEMCQDTSRQLKPIDLEGTPAWSLCRYKNKKRDLLLRADGSLTICSGVPHEPKDEG